MSGVLPPLPNAPPRAMIACLHHCKTKDLVLKLSYEQAGQFTHRGNKVSFFPDISAGLFWNKAEINTVKKQLHVAWYQVQSVSIRFSFNGSRHVFKSPENASAFVTCYMPSASNSKGMSPTPCLFFLLLFLGLFSKL